VVFERRQVPTSVGDIEVIVVGHETRGVQHQAMALEANSEPIADDFVDGLRGDEQELPAEAPSSNLVAGAWNDGASTDAGIWVNRASAVDGSPLGAGGVRRHNLCVGRGQDGFHPSRSGVPTARVQAT